MEVYAEWSEPNQPRTSYRVEYPSIASTPQSAAFGDATELEMPNYPANTGRRRANAVSLINTPPRRGHRTEMARIFERAADTDTFRQATEESATRANQSQSEQHPVVANSGVQLVSSPLREKSSEYSNTVRIKRSPGRIFTADKCPLFQPDGTVIGPGNQSGERSEPSSASTQRACSFCSGGPTIHNQEAVASTSPASETDSPVETTTPLAAVERWLDAMEDREQDTVDQLVRVSPGDMPSHGRRDNTFVLSTPSASLRRGFGVREGVSGATEPKLVKTKQSLKLSCEPRRPRFVDSPSGMPKVYQLPRTPIVVKKKRGPEIQTQKGMDGESPQSQRSRSSSTKDSSRAVSTDIKPLTPDVELYRKRFGIARSRRGGLMDGEVSSVPSPTRKTRSQAHGGYY